MITIYALIANEFYKIAEMKGFAQNKYFWLSILLGPVGYMMVITLPDHMASHESAPAASTADKLKMFRELLDSCIITQEEFEAKIKEVLGL